jgi:SAM-dependent methyltransferase
MTDTQWRDPRVARRWASQDVLQDLLALPRSIASTIVAADRPGTKLVVDIGSGPGAFLACFLDQFPDASGVWSDVSPAMEEIGRDRLARFGDRVTFEVVEMPDLGRLPSSVDVIMTSRATHHLDPAGLRAFYAAAYARLSPGGWLINLDHIAPESALWDRRLRAARSALIPPAQPGGAHHHTSALPSMAAHLDALTSVGLRDLEIAWRAFPTCLFMARRDGETAE